MIERVPPPEIDRAVRRAVLCVAILNLGYFTVEVAVAQSIGSVALFADSIDFLEDATVNALVLAALRWRPHHRALAGMLLAAVLLVPAAATVWTAWQKFEFPVAPAPLPLSLAGSGALAVNLFCAFVLARYRNRSGSLTQAAFLSARNDALASISIIAAGVLTAATLSSWPDLLVGIGIFALNLDASRQVYSTARDERRVALAQP